MTAPLLAHSATKLEDAAGRVVVCGSHGGAYAGALAVAAGVRAILLNDAGVGLDGAGIAGLTVCDGAGVAAATLSHRSCRIGHAGSAYADGVVSHVNAHAAALGLAAGQRAPDAAARLGAAATPPARALPGAEHRHTVRGGAAPVVVMDSNGLVRPGEDDGHVLITGSHGGLVGDDPASAGRAAARLFAFNDAGIGKEGAGITRLPVLEARGIAAVTVAHTSARIGDGASTLATGIISHVNGVAAAEGAQAGMALGAFVDTLVTQVAER